MNQEKLSYAIHEKSFFETLLDNACNQLQDKQARHSIKRLDELDAILCILETELDLLIHNMAGG